MRGKKVTPDIFYAPRVFIWLPFELFHVHPKCVKCQGTEITYHGWSNPIARRVIDLDRDYYILTKRIRCENRTCRKTFMPTSPEAIANLPPHLQGSFPAWLTARSGIDLKLVALMRPLFNASLGPDLLASIINEFHARRYHDLCRQYLNFIVNMG